MLSIRKYLLAISLLLTIPVCASEQGKDVEIAKEFVYHSKRLNEERTYWVSLPKDYNNSLYSPAKYPVLYLFDGEFNYAYAAAASQKMSFFHTIPEMIVVSIAAGQTRTRDFTPTHSLVNERGQVKDARYGAYSFAVSGGGDTLLDFLQYELIPHIDVTYRTLSHRTVVGHGFSGLMVAYSFVTRPALFQGYISIDGALFWDNELLLKTLEKKLVQGEKFSGRLFLSLPHAYSTGMYDAGNTSRAIQRFAETLGKHFQNVTLHRFEDENHFSVGLPSLYHGLRYIFAGHQPDLIDTNSQVSELQAHFDSWSKPLGINYPPPEKLLDAYAWYFAYQWPQGKHCSQWEKAIEFLRVNVKTYPDSSHAQDSLARMYRHTEACDTSAK